MMIVNGSISIKELRDMSKGMFGNLVKAVVDVEKGLLALNAELHSDLEALLIADGSKQKDLWGINLYPEISGEDFIEFDSMINIRPSQGNRSRGIESEVIRDKIFRLIKDTVIR
jgi:hypothetical protein